MIEIRSESLLILETSSFNDFIKDFVACNSLLGSLIELLRLLILYYKLEIVLAFYYKRAVRREGIC